MSADRLHTPAELLAIAAQEQDHKAASIAWAERVAAAATLPGLSGDLRRALRAAKVRPSRIAADCGIPLARMEAWLVAEGTLRSDELDRIAATLGVTARV
jgi:hypothetical protein